MKLTNYLKNKARCTTCGQLIGRKEHICKGSGFKGRKHTEEAKKGVELHVDHIKPWSKYKEFRFNLDNCRTMCAGCHYELTFGKPMPKSTRAWGHNLKHVISKGGDGHTYI